MKSNLVQSVEVGINIISPVSVGGIVGNVPLLGSGHVLGWLSFLLALIVHHVKTYNVLEEHMELRVRGWVHCHLKQGKEDIVQHLLETSHNAHLPVHLIESRKLKKAVGINRGSFLSEWW